MNNLDSQLIRKYITLVENVNKDIENKKPLDEQMVMFQDALKSLANTIKAEPGLFSQLKNNSDIIRKYGLNNIDDLINALKNNKIAPADAGKIVKDILKNPGTKELAIKIKGLISSEPGFIEIAKKVFPKGTQFGFDKAKMDIAKKTLAQLGITDAKAAEEMLKNAYQKSLTTTGRTTRKVGQTADDAIKAGTKADDAAKAGTKADDAAKAGTKADDAAKITKIDGEAVQIIDDGLKTGKETKNIYAFIRDYIKEIKVTIINNIKNYTIPKKLLQFLLVAGGMYLLYNLLKGNEKTIIIKDDEGNEIDKDKLPGWAECMKNLIKSGKGELTKSSKGNPIVKVKSGTGRSDIDEKNGVLFFMDYTVLSMDGKIKGTWKCKGGKVQPIGEQSSNNITNDVEIMIDLLDFPVTENDLVQANKLLQKYVDNGQGKQFLQLYNDSGLADASLETSLNYIATFNPGSVQAKNQMYDKLRKIQSGKTDSGKSSTGDPLSDIEITWDNEKKKEKEVPKKEDMYKECNKFPLYFGCKGSLVIRLQECLRMSGVDGKLGPNTKATAEAWGERNNVSMTENLPGGGGRFAVTEENFNKICGSTPIPTTTGETPTNTGTTITNTGETPTNTGTTITTTGETPTNTQHPGQELFNRLVGEKKLISRNFLGNRRFVLKDVELTSEEQKLLEDIMFEKYRYSLIRSKEDYKDGDKLVFKSIKEK